MELPIAPPCFRSQESWREFVEASDQTTKSGNMGPIDKRKSPPEFNRKWNFCRHCTGSFARQMTLQGRCNPKHLVDMRAASDSTATKQQNEGANA
jgi:hypothetical protein